MSDIQPGETVPATDRRDDLRDVIVKALEPYDIPTGSWTAAEKVEPALAVLAALGLEQVGWWHDEYGFEVTKHGIAGPDNSGEPVYRLGVTDGR